AETDLTGAEARIATWRAGLARRHDAASAEPAAGVLAQVRRALADDLDTPAALAVVDAAADSGTDDPELVASLTDALLGVRLA
ncbi:MAG TPA: cysteine--1-D-myo-inosityl 2-amino-2-deoxy-alpha-D-glucopyranoside ligase, partial [Microbacteriaceae bacterium]|nr:cysteine--1-D-myo-inosityl 2-amino-2-deoxy-alpha-D-glucopyranoside ligase [Microbacteriaceae bacterium]